MKEIHAEHLPRAKSERECSAIANDDLRARVDQVLSDWGDPTWLQFSTWSLNEIRAYLYRVLEQR